jgi:hypothetical protein
MVVDAIEDVSKVCQRVEAVQLGSLCRTPNYAEW